MKFHIITFGCKVNQCESEDVHAAMVSAGFEFSDSIENTEFIIINSCTVTAESDRKVRQTINKIKRVNFGATIVLMGCMPQAEPSVPRKIVDADIIIGNTGKTLVPEIIKNYLKSKKRIIGIESIKNITNFENTPVNYMQNRSRAFLKIEDGCNRFCSYCIIPYARGRVRSKSIEAISSDAKMLAQNGFQEIVLVGINLSSYGLDINSNLYDAVSAVAASGIPRVRLGSLEPDLMTDDLIKKLKTVPNFCPQFHLSLQSGSDKILKSMRRRYTRSDYIRLVEKLRKNFKNATFTTDIMVGFPGETELDLQDTLKIIEEVNFLKVHVFPYSRRPGTLAAEMANQISKNIKSERVKKVIEISEKTSNIVLGEFASQKMNVLYETCNKDGFYEGFTDNYILVKAKSDVDIRGKILETYLQSNGSNFCCGIFL